jgi:oligoendopeptidase F
MQERKEVSKDDQWKVEAIYPNLEAWKKDFEEVCRPSRKPHWPEIGAFKGKLAEGAETVKKFLTTLFAFERKISKLFTYAHMRHDEDLAEEETKTANVLITMAYNDFGQELAWAEPEFLSLDDATIDAYLKDPSLKEYRFHLERIVRQKPYTLSGREEELLAMAGKAMRTPGACFSAFNNADLKFPDVVDAKGEKKPLSHGKYQMYLRSKDRELRKSALQNLHNTFLAYENTICELLSGHVQQHVFEARARHYETCLEAALFPNQIDQEVYLNLIQTVRAHLPSLHKYMDLRKRALKVDELHFYDLHVPMVDEVELKYDYSLAEAIVIDSVSPLGKEYQQVLHKGLTEERWVDRYENKRKRSGAYSCGSFDTCPYILMNYNGTFNDLMTLAHEAGHSMHSYYSHKNQPYQYGHYPIFLAEVASTFNEELAFHALMQKPLSGRERAFIINQKIEDIRSTFFRQVMFAEFELFIHQLGEKDQPLTPGLLKEKYRQLNAEYFGPEVVVDPEIEIEWARIPHFYSNFYVYQYATGISAAHALFERVIQGGEKERGDYLNFLSSGSKNYPLDLLTQAGVNMRQKEPVESTIAHFDRLVGELSKLL